MGRLGRTLLSMLPPLLFLIFAAVAWVGLNRENPASCRARWWASRRRGSAGW